MSNPILATKLYIPPLQPTVVLRPRLMKMLNKGLHCKMTLISAPAGFGKTTLVREWVTSCGRPSAWLSLDDGDNDPNRFLAYLVAALQAIAQNMEEGILGMIQSPRPPPTETILTALLNEIAVATDNFLLVLDDYHLIDANPVNDAVTYLLEHLPPQMHLVLATREDPHLHLARLRARGQLTELRASDLRFNSSEASGFLNEMMGLELTAENITALETRTEGWIAGLQLAAISMQGHKDAAAFVESFTGSHKYIMDYLVEEVLRLQPSSVQTFLLCTSILDRLCGSLCEAVVPNPAASGQDTLEYIEHANLFIVPLDNERRWFRYHHLFAELLKQRLHQSDALPAGGEVNSADLHLRASVWYEDNGQVREAFHHAVAAGDFERAAGVAELAWPAMDESIQSTTWLGWVKRLPDELFRTRPVLSLGYAWALLNAGELEAGEARLRDAEQWSDNMVEDRDQTLSPSGDMVVVDEAQFRMLPAGIAAARALIAHVHGDVPGTVRFCRLTLDLIPQGDHLKRGSITALLGCSYWAIGDLEAARRTLTAGMDAMQRGGNIPWATSVTIGLAKIKVVQGRLHEAARAYEQAIQVAATQERPGIPVMAYMHAELSLVRLEQGDIETAAQHLRKSKDLGEQASFPEWQYRWCLAQARLKQVQEDLDGALEMLDEAQRWYCRTPLPDLRPVVALKAQVWIRQGRLTEAQEWVKTQGLFPDDDLSYLLEFLHITLARVLMADYQNSQSERTMLEAMGLLERLLKAAQQGGRTGCVIEILVLQALAHEAQGTPLLAMVPLERALSLAEPEGYVRIFIDEGLPMAQLLSEAAAHGILVDYTKNLLAAFESIKPHRNDSSDTPATAQALIEPLSKRELEVLQLIAQGLSNRQIGERLFLAVATVKGHNRNIFGKLQVKRRTEAVARARELGVL